MFLDAVTSLSHHAEQTSRKVLTWSPGWIAVWLVGIVVTWIRPWASGNIRGLFSLMFTLWVVMISYVWSNVGDPVNRFLASAVVTVCPISMVVKEWYDED